MHCNHYSHARTLRGARDRWLGAHLNFAARQMMLDVRQLNNWPRVAFRVCIVCPDCFVSCTIRLRVK